jgi:hypothetical protein
LLRNNVIFRDTYSGTTAAEMIVGRTSEAESKYDIRVSKVYEGIPAPRIGALCGPIVPHDAKRLR